jgi:hypothetical protein
MLAQGAAERYAQITGRGGGDENFDPGPLGRGNECERRGGGDRHLTRLHDPLVPPQSGAAPVRGRPGRRGSSAPARPGTWRSISRPARLSVHTVSPVRSGARPASRIACSMPIWRYISIVRALMPRAFGTIGVPGWRSTSSERMPCCDSRMEAVSPNRPAANNQNRKLDAPPGFSGAPRVGRSMAAILPPPSSATLRPRTGSASLRSPWKAARQHRRAVARPM